MGPRRSERDVCLHLVLVRDMVNPPMDIVLPPAIPEPDLDPFPSLPTDEPSATSPKERDGSFSSTTRPTVSAGSPQGSGNRTPTNPSSPPPARANLPSIDTTPSDSRQPHRSQSTGSGAWSTVATPGVADAQGREPRFDFETAKSGPSTQPLDQTETPTGPGSPAEDGEKKNVRFMGPDGAPLSPAQTYFSTDSYDVPSAPPPTTFSPSPTKTKPSQAVTKGVAADQSASESSATHTGASAPPTSARGRADSATRNPDMVPPPPPPSLTGYPSAPPSGLGLTHQPPAPRLNLPWPRRRQQLRRLSPLHLSLPRLCPPESRSSRLRSMRGGQYPLWTLTTTRRPGRSCAKLCQCWRDGRRVDRTCVPFSEMVDVFGTFLYESTLAAMTIFPVQTSSFIPCD